MASKYLDFRLTRDTGKTQVYSVDSRNHGDQLGVIKWYGPWRQYVMETQSGVVWNNGCLRDIIGFIEGLMRERRGRASD
jgi:hypothetical protein